MSSVGVSKADKIGQYGVQASICCLFKFAAFVWCVCVCVCVCVYVCVCLYVCVYTLPP